jgi:hypothetical protein
VRRMVILTFVSMAIGDATIAIFAGMTRPALAGRNRTEHLHRAYLNQ